MNYKLTCALALLSVIYAQSVYSLQPPENSDIELPLLGMDVSEQEQEAIKLAIQYGREISRIAETKNGLPYRRDAHAKATGCLRATFSINGDIPEHLQHSIFANPAQEYRAWIRFSNGDMVVQSDKKADARGMAIKVMEVEGQKIAPELKGVKTQDFIMTNTPAFFNRNVFDYVEDMYYLSKLKRTKWFISLFPPRLHPKLLYRAIQTVSGTIDSPLDAQYYSMLPYNLGNTELKFSAKACPGVRTESDIDKSDKDYLTEVMAEHLKTQGACFDFMVQEKVAGANMPIDDASVIWSEKKSPFIPIARVNIPPQDFTSLEQQNFCENISMNPWHGVGDWEPLGSLNRARRLVYNAVSAFRHEKNEAKRVEPNSWCLSSDGQCDLNKHFYKTKSKWPLPMMFDPQSKPIEQVSNQTDTD
jgi:hypothetical protein